MFLPEHKEALQSYRQQSLVKTPPELDQQKLDEISSVIQASCHHHIPVKLTVFDEDEDKQMVGTVTQLDPHGGKLKLKRDQDHIWITYAEIIDIETVE